MGHRYRKWRVLHPSKRMLREQIELLRDAMRTEAERRALRAVTPEPPTSRFWRAKQTTTFSVNNDEGELKRGHIYQFTGEVERVLVDAGVVVEVHPNQLEGEELDLITHLMLAHGAEESSDA